MPEKTRDSELLGGLRLCYMQGRVEHFHGTLSIGSSASGTIVEATVPLSSMINPSEDKPK